jgi:protein required for attachment to host cells
MSRFWIVVADSCKARVFTAPHQGGTLNEVANLLHLEGHLHDRDVNSDKPGAISGGHGEGDHAFAPTTERKQHELAKFAKQIAERLEQGRVDHDFDKLILVAPPAVLGVLRDALNDRLRDLIYEELDKNLVTADVTVISEHIF